MDEKIFRAMDTLYKTLESRQQDDTNPFRVIEKMSEKTGLPVLDCITNLISLKLARVECGVSLEDSLVDIAGYAVLGLAYEKKL